MRIESYFFGRCGLPSVLSDPDHDVRILEEPELVALDNIHYQLRPVRALDGTIRGTASDTDVVVIGLGEDEGIHAGDSFIVTRNGALVSFGTVLRPRAHVSTARVGEGARVGDKVTVNLPR